MRHRVRGKKLNRSASQRRALEKGLIRSFFEYGKIETTLAKAKFIRPKAEKLVTLARKDGLSSYRALLSYLQSDKLVKKLKTEIAPLFMGVPGGYTKITHLGPRQSDRTEMATIEWSKTAPKAKEEIKKDSKDKKVVKEKKAKVAKVTKKEVKE